MIFKSTGKAPVHPSRSSFAQGLRPGAITRNLRHARALARMLRRRHSVALGIGMVSASALSALAATTAVHVVHHSNTVATVAPLAPPVPPPAPPVEIRHHKSFLSNPLRGIASWYGDVWQGRRTASGEIFDDNKMTACHKTLPFGTVVRVTDVHTSRSVVVKINDRGTLVPGRIIDLSSAAASRLGILENGLANVRLEVLGRAPIERAPAVPKAAVERPEEEVAQVPATQAKPAE